VNDYLLSALLGVIEGLTEFLPVSSTAHLRIVEEFFRKSDSFWLMYTIVIQLGAVLCLPVYFRRRIGRFVASFPRGEHGDRNAFNHPLTLTFIAFLATAIPAFLLTKVIGNNLKNIYVIGGALVIGGVVMWVVDRLFTRPVTHHMQEMTFGQALWIGLVQTLSAIFPGTSRSMSTIAAGQIAGMNRSSALEFSFFLSMPTMAAATLYDFYKTVIKHKGEEGQALPPVTMSHDRWVLLAIGFAISFVVALVVVHWFMGWVRKRGFTPFAIYRIVLGGAVLVWAWRGVHVAA
jgi:undecaprenyl-diphosphatase